jgi:hypothetical protein
VYGFGKRGIYFTINIEVVKRSVGVGIINFNCQKEEYLYVPAWSSAVQYRGIIKRFYMRYKKWRDVKRWERSVKNDKA